MAVFDLDFRLGVLALLAENKFIDEAIKMILKLGGFVSTIDDPAVVSGIIIGLCSELEAEVFDDIYGSN